MNDFQVGDRVVVNSNNPFENGIDSPSVGDNGVVIPHIDNAWAPVFVEVMLDKDHTDSWPFSPNEIDHAPVE